MGPLLPQRGSPPPDMEGVVAAPSMPQLLPSSPPRLHTAIQVSFNDESAAQENRIRYLSGQYKCSNGAFRILQQQHSRPWWAHVLWFRLGERLLTWLQPRLVGMMGGAGVSISSDFLPLGSSTRSRMLELNVEYRDRWQGKIFLCS